MKDTPLSNCERDFLLKAIEEKKVSWFLNAVSTLCKLLTYETDAEVDVQQEENCSVSIWTVTTNLL